MKKRSIFVFSLAAMLFCLVHSCMMDEAIENPHKERDEQLIKDAMRKYYDFSPEEGLIELRSSQGIDDMPVKPVWENARVHEDKNSRVVEIPLTSELYFSYATPDAAEKVKETRDRRYRQSKTNFVYLEDRSTDTEEMFMMTIVPDLSYLESTRFQPFDKMSYLKRDESFNGIIFYHDMEGRYVNGWRYTDGKVTGTVMAHTEKPDFDLVRTRSMVCNDHYLVIYVETCYSWGYYENGSEVVTGSECSSHYEYEYWYTECSDDGSGGYGGDGGYGGGSSGGGGGGSSSGGGTPKTPTNRTDCPPGAATNGSGINTVLNSVCATYPAQSAQTYVNLLRSYAENQSIEYAITVQYASDEYYVLNVGSSTYMVSGTVNSVTVTTNLNSYLIAHTHPSGTNPAPSPLDAIVLANNYKTGSLNITANVVFGKGGTEYMVYVNDRGALSAFCNNPANSQFFVGSGAMFKTGSNWANDYNAAYNNMKTKGYSDNDAQSYALAYVLDKYNTGLKIYEKKSGSFKEQKTELSSSNYLPKICP